MNRRRAQNGFSFSEVLIALLLLCSSIVAILQQEWHLAQFMRQLQWRNAALLQLDNISEQWLAHGHWPPIEQPFQYKVIPEITASTVELSCLALVEQAAPYCQLQRRLQR